MSIKYNKETCKYDETTEPIFNPSQTSAERNQPTTKQAKESKFRDKTYVESQMLVFDCETNGLLHDVQDTALPSTMPERKRSYLTIT